MTRLVGRLVVVGASLAGLRAVEAARQAGFTGEVVLVGDEVHPPYDRPPLSKAYLSDDVPVHLPFRTPAQLGELGVELRLGVPATGLDAAGRRVRVGDEELPYDALVVATGSAPRVLPGPTPAGVHVLRTREDADVVRSALDAGARTVVVGAGFVGAEVASAARARGLPVEVVEAGPVPLARAVGPEVGALLGRLHGRYGTTLRCRASVHGFTEVDGRVTGVQLAEGEVLPADLVVVGVGTRPAADWLGGALPRHPVDGGLLADATLRVIDGVWAAGDVVHVTTDGRPARHEHWTAAAEQGALAGRNAVTAGPGQAWTSVPYFWSDWYGHRIQGVGTSTDAELDLVDRGDRLLALHHRGDVLVGATTVDRPGQVMKLRRLVGHPGSWSAARDLTAPALTRS